MVDILELFDTRWFGERRSSLIGSASHQSLFSNEDGVSESSCLIQERRSPGRQARTDMEPSSGDASSQRTIHSRSEAVTAHPSTEANAESSGKGSLLGTWAHRQRIFGLLTGSPQQHQSSEHRRTDLGKEKQEVKQDQDQIEEKEYMDEAALNEQAWKWRFTRKWQMEQLNGQEKDPEEDDWMSAMHLIGNGGSHLQFGRGSSLEKADSFVMALSQSTASLLATDSLKMESDLMAGSRDDALLASKELTKVASRAEKLLEYQKEIEKNVANRWKLASETWVGAFLPAVKVDTWGSYKFILGKVVERTGRYQKLILRGSNRHTEHQAIDAARKEVSSEIKSRRLDWARLDILGVGVIRWISQRESKVEMSCTTMFSGVDMMFRCKSDILNAASAILQSQSTSFKVVMKT